MGTVEGNNYTYDAMLFTNKVKSQDNSYGIDKLTVDEICG